jgi:hypothetical protein
MAPSGLTAQATPGLCDRDLEELARGPHGYRLRDERCEGVFAQPVGGTPLFVVSLTQYFDYEDLGPSDSLLIDWPAPGDPEVRLRAEGISPGLHYRMDAVRPVGSESFTWPADILVARDIDREDVGVLGWFTWRIGDRERNVLVPLRVRPADEHPVCGSYTLTLWTGPRLDEVFVTLAPLETDGRPGEAVWDARPLDWRYYPAESPIAIPLPDLSEPGFYYVKVAAERRGGGSSTVEAWVYHPRTAPPGCGG